MPQHVLQGLKVGCPIWLEHDDFTVEDRVVEPEPSDGGGDRRKTIGPVVPAARAERHLALSARSRSSDSRRASARAAIPRLRNLLHQDWEARERSCAGMAARRARSSAKGQGNGCLLIVCDLAVGFVSRGARFRPAGLAASTSWRVSCCRRSGPWCDRKRRSW